MDPEANDPEAPPPWTLHGEAVVAVVPTGAKGPGGDGPGPDRLPGPAVVLAANWTHTPVGPYRELAVVVPARNGVRPGWTVTTMVVDSEASQRGGRTNWGMPKQLGRLDWQPSAERPGLSWAQRSINVRCRGAWRLGPAWPVLAPIPLLQRREGEIVAMTGRGRGSARPALVEIDVPPVDELSGLAGRYLGLHLPQVRLWLGSAEAR